MESITGYLAPISWCQEVCPEHRRHLSTKITSGVEGEGVRDWGWGIWLRKWRGGRGRRGGLLSESWLGHHESRKPDVGGECNAWLYEAENQIHLCLVWRCITDWLSHARHIERCERQACLNQPCGTVPSKFANHTARRCPARESHKNWTYIDI